MHDPGSIRPVGPAPAFGYDPAGPMQHESVDIEARRHRIPQNSLDDCRVDAHIPRLGASQSIRLHLCVCHRLPLEPNFEFLPGIMQTMIKWPIYRLHWLLGLTAGVVLSVMGVTGALMAFEDEIMPALSHGIVDVPLAATPALSPDELLARFAQQSPDSPPT